MYRERVSGMFAYRLPLLVAVWRLQIDFIL